MRIARYLLILDLRGRSAGQHIRVSWTKVRLGGERPCMHCPHCEVLRTRSFVCHPTIPSHTESLTPWRSAQLKCPGVCDQFEGAAVKPASRNSHVSGVSLIIGPRCGASFL
jgi:hypothetical protein